MARNLNLQIIASGTVDLKSIKEWDFQVALGKYAESRGWKVHYTKQTGFMGKSGKWRSMSPQGWPDMFMVRNGQAISAELKADRTSKPRPEQQEWLTELAAVPGIETYLWRPRDASEAMEILR